LKGSFLHKKIELFINALAKPMEDRGVKRMCVANLLSEELPNHEYAAREVMKHVAPCEDPVGTIHSRSNFLKESWLQMI